MPRYLNITRNTRLATLANGNQIAFPPYTTVTIELDQMSPSIGQLIQEKVLKYRGGGGTTTVGVATKDDDAAGDNHDKNDKLMASNSADESDRTIDERPRKKRRKRT